MSNNITKTKQELFNFIENLNITTSNYEDILYLVQNCDDALFTKIIEEMKNGHLVLNDFTRLFKENDSLEESIDKQEKLYNEHTLLRERLLNITALYRNTATNKISANYGTYENTLRLKNLTTQFANKDANNKITASASDIEKQNFILSVIDQPTDDPLEDLYRVNMINKMLDTTDSDFIDSMLLSLHDYLVPVDYEHIVLTEHDKEFAKNNNMTDDDMKKMKSLAAFLSTYYE